MPKNARIAALLALAGALAMASCDRCGGEAAADKKDAAPATPPPSAPPSASSTAPPSERDAAPAAAPANDASTTFLDAAAPDAGPSACRLAYGPAEQPFRGPAAVIVAGSELKLIANDGGKPRVYPIALGAPPPASAPVPAPKPSSFVAMRWPPCEVAGRWAYCQAVGGIVYRTTLGANDSKQIVKSAPSTRITAAALGPDHAVVATLDSRRTTEGVMLQAFVTLDDGETARLSDDGAGATVLRVVPRAEGAVALYLDARMAMLPVHARPMSLRGKELVLADDAVVFVGGPPERGIDLTGAVAGKSLFALIATSRETSDFGMAAIPIAEHPKDDVLAAWSLYPNGLDPAPMAATTHNTGEGPAWVARVRPSERAAGSPRILELGRLDAVGAFTSLGAIATDKRITDIAIAADSYGSVWVLYGDANATWLERRVCPSL